MSEIDTPKDDYGLIYADPPWSYEQGDIPNGGVDSHYETMDIDDIKALDVPAAEDCILYLWGTVTHVPEAMQVIDAWGFEYKTQAVWDKQKLGVGFWFRGEHENLYVATKGDVSPPDPDVRRSSIFREERGKHSAKPDKVRAYIERAHPDREKVELFSRDGRVGWDMWGDEAVTEPQSTFESLEL